MAEASTRTRTSQLIGRIRSDLLDGTLAPAAPLRLSALRERYSVGLTPLREALFQLVAEGLVTVEDQRGFRAAPISKADLIDLTEQRIYLESQALRLAIANGNLEWESQVLAAHHSLAGTPMLDASTHALRPEWAQVHRDFHTALVAPCGSPWLLRIRELLSDHAERYRQVSVLRDPRRDVAGEHAGIVAAVLSRNSALASERIADHYRRTAQACHLGDETTDDPLDRS